MINVALFVDLENVTKQIDYGNLITSVTKTIENRNNEVVNIVIRTAVGNEASLKKVSTDLNYLNFDIKLSIKNGSKKNKSDLIISTDAMECLVNNNPVVDYFVFVTSDSDFSIVASKLKKFGKRVCFVVKEEDVKKTIFSSISEEVISIKEYYIVNEEDDFIIELKKEYNLKKEEDVKVFLTMMKTLVERSKSKYFTIDRIKVMFRGCDKNVNFKSSNFKSYQSLFELLESKKIIKFKEGNKKEVKVIDHLKIKKVLEGGKNVK